MFAYVQDPVPQDIAKFPSGFPKDVPDPIAEKGTAPGQKTLLGQPNVDQQPSKALDRDEGHQTLAEMSGTGKCHLPSPDQGSRSQNVDACFHCKSADSFDGRLQHRLQAFEESIDRLLQLRLQTFEDNLTIVLERQLASFFKKFDTISKQPKVDQDIVPSAVE